MEAVAPDMKIARRLRRNSRPRCARDFAVATVTSRNRSKNDASTENVQLPAVERVPARSEGYRVWHLATGPSTSSTELTASLLRVGAGGLNRGPDLGRGQRHVEVRDPERRQGVEHGMHDRRRGAD